MTPKAKPKVIPFTREQYERDYPVHTCVDRPKLECAACNKWAKKKRAKRVSA